MIAMPTKVFHYILRYQPTTRTLSKPNQSRTPIKPKINKGRKTHGGAVVSVGNFVIWTRNRILCTASIWIWWL